MVLYLIMSGKASGWNGGLGQNGWGPGYLGEYNLSSAFIFEVVATFLFLVCTSASPSAARRSGLRALLSGLRSS